MNGLDNPYESPQMQAEHQKARKAGTRSRFWFLLGSMAFVFVVPGCLQWILVSEQERQFIEISSLGGLLFLAAFWTLILGWLFLSFGIRTLTIVAGTVGLSSTIALPFVLGELTDYLSPIYWSGIAAYVLLIAGGVHISQTSAPPGR